MIKNLLSFLVMLAVLAGLWWFTDFGRVAISAWYFLQGEAALQNHQWTSAQTFYQQALPNFPWPDKIYLRQGDMQIRQNAPLKALTFYEKALASAPRSYEALQKVATLKIRNGEFNSALQTYFEGLQANPTSQEIKADIGMLYALMGKADKNPANYQRAVNLLTDYFKTEKGPAFRARFALGDSYYALGNYEGSLNQYCQLLTFYPEDAASNYALALSLNQLGAYQSAAHYMKTAAELADGDQSKQAPIWVRLSAQYQQHAQGQADKTTEAVQNCLNTLNEAAKKP